MSTSPVQNLSTLQRKAKQKLVDCNPPFFTSDEEGDEEQGFTEESKFGQLSSTDNQTGKISAGMAPTEYTGSRPTAPFNKTRHEGVIHISSSKSTLKSNPGKHNYSQSLVLEPQIGLGEVNCSENQFFMHKAFENHAGSINHLKYDPTKDLELREKELAHVEREISHISDPHLAVNFLTRRVVDSKLEAKKFKIMHSELSEEFEKKERQMNGARVALSNIGGSSGATGGSGFRRKSLMAGVPGSSGGNPLDQNLKPSAKAAGLIAPPSAQNKSKVKISELEKKVSSLQSELRNLREQLKIGESREISYQQDRQKIEKEKDACLLKIQQIQKENFELKEMNFELKGANKRLKNLLKNIEKAQQLQQLSTSHENENFSKKASIDQLEQSRLTLTGVDSQQQKLLISSNLESSYPHDETLNQSSAFLMNSNPYYSNTYESSQLAGGVELKTQEQQINHFQSLGTSVPETPSMNHDNSFNTPATDSIPRQAKKIVKFNKKAKIGGCPSPNDLKMTSKPNFSSIREFTIPANKLSEAQQKQDELSAEAENLKQTIRDLEQEKTDLEQEKTELEEERTELIKRIEELQSDNKKLANFLKQMKSRVSSLNSQITELELSRTELLESQLLTETQFTDSGLTLEQIETGEPSLLKGQLRKWFLQIRSLQTAEIDLKKKIEIFRENSKALNAENNQLRESLDRAILTRDQTELELNQERNERAKLNSQVAEMASQQNAGVVILKENRSLKGQLVETQSKLKILQTDFLSLGRQNDQLKAEVTKLELKIATMHVEQEKNAKLELRCQDLEGRLAQLVTGVVSTESVEILESENKRLKQQIRSKVDDLSVVNSRLLKLQNDLKEQESKNQRQAEIIKKLTLKKQELMKELIELEGRLDGEVEGLNHQSKVVKEERDTLQFELERMRKEVQRLEDENLMLSRLELQNSELLRQKKELVRAKNEINNELKKTLTLLETKASKMDELKLEISQLGALDQNTKEIREKNSELEGLLIQKEAELNSLRKTMEFMAQKEKKGASNNTELMLRLNKMEDLVAKSTAKSNELSAKLDEIELENDKLRAEVKERDIFLKKQKVDFDNELRIIEQDTAKRGKDIDKEHHQELVEIRTKLEESENQCFDLRKNIKAIESDFRQKLQTQKEQAAK